MMKRLILGMVASLLVAFPALGQLPPSGGLVVGNGSTTGTPVQGGTSTDCLTVGTNNRLTQTGLCGAAAGITVGTSTITGGTTTRVLYDNAGVLGEYTLTGSGTVVAMQNSPSLTTPNINVATGTSLALASCTLGSFAVCATGNAQFIYAAGSPFRLATTAAAGATIDTNDMLHVYRGAGGFMQIRMQSSTATFDWGVHNTQGAYFFNNANTPTYFGTNGTDRARFAAAGHFVMASALYTGWTSAGDSSGTVDTLLSRINPGVVGVGLTAAGQVTGAMQMASITMGASSLTLTTGAVGLSKMTASASAPGAGGGKLELVCGTNAGSLKLIVYGGTSTTAVTVTDNIGSGATGC